MQSSSLSFASIANQTEDFRPPPRSLRAFSLSDNIVNIILQLLGWTGPPGVIRPLSMALGDYERDLAKKQHSSSITYRIFVVSADGSI